MADERVAYELWQEGVAVAYVEAPTEEEALREIQHYALVYSQDGPVEIRRVGGGPEGLTV